MSDSLSSADLAQVDKLAAIAAGDIMGELGESPEAARGAQAVIHAMSQIVLICGDDQSNMSTQQITMLILMMQTSVLKQLANMLPS